MHVTFSYDDKYRVPASAKAAIVAPSLVSDRYVQLLPVYQSGPALAAGTRIPLGAHGSSRRARPRVPEPRRPHGGARTRRRQQERRAQRAAAHLRGQPRRQRRQDQRHGPRPLDRAVDPVRQPRRPLRHGEEPPVLHLDAGDEQRAGAAAQLRPRDRRDPAQRGAREPQGDAREPRCRRRRGVGLRLRQPRAAQEQPRPGGHRDQRVRQEPSGPGAAPRERPRRAVEPPERLPPRDRHARHPQQRQGSRRPVAARVLDPDRPDADRATPSCATPSRRRCCRSCPPCRRCRAALRCRAPRSRAASSTCAVPTPPSADCSEAPDDVCRVRSRVPDAGPPLVVLASLALGAAAPTTCRSPAAPAPATTPTPSRPSSPTCSTSCRSRRSRSTR